MTAPVVVVGSGSAGRRHASELLTQVPDRRVLMVRRRGSSTPDAPLAALGVELVEHLDAALEHRPSLAVIAAPAPFHASTALSLLDAGCHVLLEKPLAHRLDDPSTRRLLERRSDHDRVLVGYHLRFGDVLPFLSACISEGQIGEPRRARFEVGQHLGSWRPGAAASESVSGRSELGGGVLLELSHEFDALRAVLDADVATVDSCDLRHDGAPTDGTVETCAQLELRLTSGVPCSVHLDMTSDPPVRRWRVEGAEGTLDADLLTSTVVLERAGREAQRRSFPRGERDRAETRLIAHLSKMERDGETPRCTVDDGVAALEVVEAARRSAEARCPVVVDRHDRSAA